MNKWLLLLAVPVLLGAALFGGGSGSGTGGSGGGANDHFDTRCADGNKVACWSLRSNSSINDVLTGSTTAGVDAIWEYDATEDAAELTIPIGDNLSLSTGEGQLHGSFSEVNPSNSNMLSYQTEFKYASDWADVENDSNYTGGYVDFTTHKQIRLDYTTLAKEDRVIEFQLAYNDTVQGTSDPVAVFRVRSYAQTIDENNLDGQVPIRLLIGGDRDEQPGGDTAAWQIDRPFTTLDHAAGDNCDGGLCPFLFTPDVWIRVTCTWDWTSGDGAVEFSCEASDENTDTVTIFESVETPGSGMLIQPKDRTVTGSSDLDFNDNGASEDTIFHPNTNWRGEGFTDNFTFDVTGTTNNDGTYTVTDVSTTTTSNDTLHVATGSFTDEQNTSATVTQTGFQKSGGDLLRFPEFNSSQGDEVTAIEFKYYQRNTIIWKDAAIPHGGRPG